MTVVPTVLHPENDPNVDLHPKTDAGQVADFLNKTYPVGSVYMSVDSTSPASLFGGTWTAITSGFLVSAGYSGITAGSMGGGTGHRHDVSPASAQLFMTRVGSPSVATCFFKRSSTETWTSERKQEFQTNSVDAETTQINGTPLIGYTDYADSLPHYYGVNMWRRVV